jgi:hypothetical protein
MNEVQTEHYTNGVAIQQPEPPQLVRLHRDLREASVLGLGQHEIRFLVDIYYQKQEARKAEEQQYEALKKSGEPNAFLEWVYKDSKMAENEIKKQLDYYTDHEPTGMGRWCKCAPEGSIVTCEGWEDIPIEELKTGNRVMSFDRNKFHVHGKRSGAGKEIIVEEQDYLGDLIGVGVQNNWTRTTPDHKWPIKWEKDRSLYIVYLMKKGSWFRVGWSRLFDNQGGFELTTRMRTEGADAGWILSVHSKKDEASWRESYISVMYGIPLSVFHPVGNSMQTEENIYSFLNSLDLQEQRSTRAIQCLHDHGRSIHCPLIAPYHSFINNGKRMNASPLLVQAANLIPEIMYIAVPEKEKGQQVCWEKLDQVSRKPYSGKVYSLEVEKYHTYIQNGLATHNSIHGIAEVITAGLLAHIDIEGLQGASSIWRYCFPAGTLIQTPQGDVPIEAVQSQDTVFSDKGEWTSVLNTFKRNFTGTLVTLKARGMLPLSLTDEHPVLVRDNETDTPRWVESKNVKLNQWVHFSYSFSPPIKEEDLIIGGSPKAIGKNPHYTIPLTLDEDLAYLLGYFVADGSTTLYDEQGATRGTTYITLCNDDDPDIIARLKKTAERFGPVSSAQVQDNVFYFKFGRRYVAEWFRKHMGRDSRTKRVPSFILAPDCSRNVKRFFLLGYLEAEGCFDEGGCHVNTVSKTLALQIQRLALSLGVFVPSSQQKRAEFTVINGREVSQAEFRYNMSLRPCDVEMIKHGKPGSDPLYTNRRPLFEESGVWTPVSHISFQENWSGVIYNIETEKHTYMAQNISVHNCGYDPTVKWWSREESAKLVKAVMEELNTKHVTDDVIAYVAERSRKHPEKLYKWAIDYSKKGTKIGTLVKEAQKELDLPDIINDTVLQYVSQKSGRPVDTLLGITVKSTDLVNKVPTPTSLASSLSRRPWNANMKVLAFKIGDSFMKNCNKPQCFYGHRYKEKRAYYEKKSLEGAYRDQAAEILRVKNIGKEKKAYEYYARGELPPSHIVARAKRWTVKLFLAHFFDEWYRRHNKCEPPKPYPIAFLGHAHVIKPPNPDYYVPQVDRGEHLEDDTDWALLDVE